MMTHIGASTLAFALLFGGTAMAQAPRLRAQVESQRVYLGEPFPYRLTLSNASSTSEPELPEAGDLKVELVGQTPLMSSFSITIINGRQTQRQSDQGRRYDYRITPLKPGRITIPAASAVVDGVKIQSQAITIDVIGPTEQDVANLQITADHTTVYPLQPFTVTLKLYVKALPGRYAKENPAHLGLDRVLTIPWVDPENVAADLTSSEDLNTWLGPLQRRNGWGFNINNLGSPGVFSLFGNNASTFELPAKPVQRKDADGREVQYWEYTLSRTFQAKSTGPLEFGPVTLKGRFGTESDEEISSQLNIEEIYAVAPALQIQVNDVPTAGRPDSYTGAVGTFTFHADLKPRQARVGDPMTLTLTLRGDGLLETAGAPNLEAVPEIANGFKVYEASEETKGNERIFTYSVRPQSTKVTELPPVPISYFSTAEEKYVTVYTDPLPVEISAAERLSARDIVAGRAAGESGAPVEAAQDGIFANMSTPANLVDERVRPEWWLGGLGALAVTYFAASLMAMRIRTRNADPAALRRRAAVAQAKAHLAAGNAAAASDPQQAITRYRTACTSLIASALLIDEAAITARDIDRLAPELELNESTTSRVKRFIDACDGARYAGVTAESGALRAEAEALVALLATELKGKGKLS